MTEDIHTSIKLHKRGWKSEKTSVKCQSCQAISVFDPAKVAQRCDFCGSAQIVPYEQVKAPIRPESLLPFQIAEARVREEMRHCGDFDYVLMNQEFARAVDNLCAIVRSARLTAARQMVRHGQLLQRLLEP